MSHRLAAALWLCLALLPAARAGQSLTLGGELLWFDYREFDSAGTLLDKETGPLPGFIAAWQLDDEQWFVAAEGEVLPGVVAYDGQTQSGIPTRTDTRTFLFDARLLAGRRFGGGRHPHRFFAGAGYHYWYRDILPGFATDGTPTVELLETYQWAYLLFGTRLTLWQNPRHALWLDARYRWMLAGTMGVDFKGYNGYDNTTVALATEDGWRLGLAWALQLAPGRTLTVEPYLSAWNLGRSDLAALTRGGLLTGDVILEPRSETRNAGLRVGYHLRF